MKHVIRRSFSGVAAFAAAPLAALEDIRGLRPPVVVPPWWEAPLIAALVTAGVVVVAFGARALWRRWRRPETPHEAALRALAAAEAHARAGDARAWAEIVADTVRTSLAVRLGAVVLPQTTSELAKARWAAWVHDGGELPKEGDPVRLAEAASVLALLDVCDLTRFARARIAPDALAGFTACARSLVDAFHAPRPAARTAAPAAPSTV